MSQCLAEAVLRCVVHESQEAGGGGDEWRGPGRGSVRVWAHTSDEEEADRIPNKATGGLVPKQSSHPVGCFQKWETT